MDEFQKFGRWVEDAVKRIVHEIETDIAPKVEKSVVQAMRVTSAKLAECAEKLEKRAQRASA